MCCSKSTRCCAKFFSRVDRVRSFFNSSRYEAQNPANADKTTPLTVPVFFFALQWFISQQVPQFEDVKFEAASILSELFCQQVNHP